MILFLFVAREIICSITPCAMLVIRDNVENKRASLLVVSFGKHLTGRLHLYVRHRWPTCTSPGYNCEVAHPTCCKR